MESLSYALIGQRLKFAGVPLALPRDRLPSLITSSRYRELLAEINISMPDSYVEETEHAD